MCLLLLRFGLVVVVVVFSRLCLLLLCKLLLLFVFVVVVVVWAGCSVLALAPRARATNALDIFQHRTRLLASLRLLCENGIGWSSQRRAWKRKSGVDHRDHINTTRGAWTALITLRVCSKSILVHIQLLLSVVYVCCCCCCCLCLLLVVCLVLL